MTTCHWQAQKMTDGGLLAGDKEKHGTSTWSQNRNVIIYRKFV